MAVTADTGEYKVSRGDVYSVDPRALKVDWRKNIARAGQKPPLDDDLKALAMDMMPKKGPGDSAEGSSGQINPIVVRPFPDRTLEVVGGFRRMRAALWLIESGLCPDFEIKYTITRLGDRECALTNVSENLQRKDPDPVQLAHSVRCLHEDYKLSMATIAGRLKKTEKWLNQIMNLVMLPTEIQDSVSKRQTAVSAAIELTKVEPSKQTEVFNAARDSNGKVTASAIKDQTREHKEGPTPRTAKHLKAFCEGHLVKGDPSREFAKATLNYLEGRPRSEEGFQKAWDHLFPIT